MSTYLGFALLRLRRGYGVLVSAVLWAASCATTPELLSPTGSYLQGAGPALGLEIDWQEAGSNAAWAPSQHALPSDWPEEASSDEELLEPFLACPSTAHFLALQRRVDMARVVESLGNWGAVRLGAQGPLVDATASRVLTSKRAAFLVEATADYGAYSQIFALFIIHTAYDDELDALLRLLARDKQLGQTLGQMDSVRRELARRGLKLADYPERGERAGDVRRGLEQAARDALNSSLSSDGARYLRMTGQLQQMPPVYQQAQADLERELMREHYSPAGAALGSFDHLTFGVPLGVYHLVAGTAHGVKELTQGQYEQATRELAPAALLVALYAGGKGIRYLAEAERARLRLSVPEVRLEALKQVAWQVGERLGLDGLAELARYIRASREAAVFVGAGGEPAAVALYEARGNLARAQAWLSEARPERTGAAEPSIATGRTLGAVRSLIDEAAGYSLEVVEAKLGQAELEAPGPRLPANVALLQKLRSTLSSPPPGVPEGSTLWSEYVSYRQQRLAALEQGRAAAGPLRWAAYEQMRGAFARGLAFERAMVSVLRADAALPLEQRHWLKSFRQPRIEVHVGMTKPGVPGVRFADVLVIEQVPPAGQPARVETFSFKSRNLAVLQDEALRLQMGADALAAVDYYGGTVDIRRPSLERRAQVRRVRLIYEGGKLLPRQLQQLEQVMEAVERQVQGVEVLIQ
ncbi:hypothetical protein [Hyalangium versicolor]|uniref:hypothetical protein n=1 Tax=Hyalangium versicolor TaxID=2861190 RepID=UPI001CCA9051|nr:hypothetical protein [Hyalangium versicolor]